MSDLPEWIQSGIQPLIKDDPAHRRRSAMRDYEWKTVKEAIDGIREDEEDASARQALMYYDLWDYGCSMQDEHKIKYLYDEYS